MPATDGARMADSPSRGKQECIKQENGEHSEGRTDCSEKSLTDHAREMVDGKSQPHRLAGAPLGGVAEGHHQGDRLTATHTESEKEGNQGENHDTFKKRHQHKARCSNKK